MDTYLEVREESGNKSVFARLMFNEPGPSEEELKPLRELCDKHSLEIIEDEESDMDLEELMDAIKDEYEHISKSELVTLRLRIAELERDAEMACLDPRPDCGCAGCLRADKLNGL